MPSYLSKAARPTGVPPKYMSDGKGRDSFITFADGGRAPSLLPKCKFACPKGAPAKHPAIMPRFVPSGTGRDLFCQVTEDKVMPAISYAKPAVVRKQDYTGAKRHIPSPTYKPVGSGRDLFIICGYDAAYAPRSRGFKTLPPSPVPKRRTSPPPKFVATGSGRDSFQNPNYYRPQSTIPERCEGFVYGSNTISRNARYKYKGNNVRVSAQSQRETSYRLMSSPIKKKSRPSTVPDISHWT